MQNRYVGDVGDFGKYGLLRRLSGMTDTSATSPQLRLGVVWCLYPDEEHNADGKYVGYLCESVAKHAFFRSCDPELYDALREIVTSRTRRVSSIPAHGILPENTDYYDQVLYYQKETHRRCREVMHAEWIDRALVQSSLADMVFVDPDNGIFNGPLHWRKTAPKYTYVEDLRKYVQRGQSLMIYHHLSRQGTAAQQIRRCTERLQYELGLAQPPWAIWYHRGSARCYFIIAQDEHAPDLANRIDRLLDSPWRAHFEMVR